MKKISSLIVGLLLSVGLHAGVKSGTSAPEFTLSDSAGVEHSLSDFKGSYVVLEWTNHQCPFVVKHYSEGHMQALQGEMTEKGVVWLQINSGAVGKQGHVSAEAAEALRKEKGFKSTAYLLDGDGAVGRAYDARTTPHVYLIDPAGTLVYHGAIDSIKSVRASDVDKAENYLKAAYAAHSSGEPIAQPTTTPYGCSVKY